MRSPAELTATFRASGRKVTPQRERIFQVLYENQTHPTAERVHAAVTVDMPSVSLRTVYATLTELADMGELVPLELGTGSARFDPNTAHHHHLVCRGCGSVVDVDVEHSGLRPDPAAVGDFAIDTTQIVFRGRCASCAAAEAPDPDSRERSQQPPIHKEQPHG